MADKMDQVARKTQEISLKIIKFMKEKRKHKISSATGAKVKSNSATKK
jgi:hypothetical protein